ncbi:hypothetical protein CLOM_g587, partial [Closterium sp. NIES-68]
LVGWIENAPHHVKRAIDVIIPPIPHDLRNPLLLGALQIRARPIHLLLQIDHHFVHFAHDLLIPVDFPQRHVDRLENGNY